MHRFCNINKYQYLWQIANVQGRLPWFQQLSTSSINSDAGNEEASFGQLSSNPSSEFYEKGILKKHKDYGKTRFNDDCKESKEKESLTYQQTRALKKWHGFKKADKDRIAKLSQNLIQDDKEEDYFEYRNKRKPNREEKSIDNKLKDRTNHEHFYSLPKTQNVSQEDAGTAFGTLSPIKIFNENIEGDEGDVQQEKYEAATGTRKHKAAYYGFRMKKLVSERKLTEAIKILEEEMPAAFVKPDNFCYQVLINACGRAGYTKKAFQLYNQMKKRGLKVEPVTYTGLFEACANSPWLLTDGLKRAHKLRNQLQEKGFIFNQTISHVMIKAFGKCGDIKTAFGIVDEMIEQRTWVNTETINHVLQACISDKDTGFRYALLIWRKMRELRLVPDIYSYNLLTRCIHSCKAGDPELTSQLLEADFDRFIKKPKPELMVEKVKELEDARLGDAVVFNYKEKEVNFSEEVVEKDSVEISEDKKFNLELQNDTKNIVEDNNTFQLEVLDKNHDLVKLANKDKNTVEENEQLPNLLGRRITKGCIVALNSLDKAEDRLALLGGPPGFLRQMILDKVKPDLKTITQLIESLPNNNEAEEALLQSMNNIELVPDTQFCNMLIRKRCFRRDIESAKDVLDVMTKHRLMPDLITFGCLALGCQHLHNAAELLKDMDALEFRPNLEIMTILVKNGIYYHRHFYILEMLREMNEREISPDENLINLLENARKRARQRLLSNETKLNNDLREKRKIEEIKLFLLEYKSWLKKSNLEMVDHPWAQYRSVAANSS